MAISPSPEATTPPEVRFQNIVEGVRRWQADHYDDLEHQFRFDERRSVFPLLPKRHVAEYQFHLAPYGIGTHGITMMPADRRLGIEHLVIHSLSKGASVLYYKTLPGEAGTSIVAGGYYGVKGGSFEEALKRVTTYPVAADMQNVDAIENAEKIISGLNRTVLHQ